ncbi:MAG: Glycogen synthase [Thermococcales archaeon 44_46]|uniref:glycogen synthase n=1 Tax=Thermococcus bergensis TaxID=2689387 RepID=UPI00074962CA|nr:glycogen synthase [Thermococcus bergensis]KUJ99385.1 MAG: Glycogen synthase [Thermococcales archaeon 44_46]MCA6213888.1 glycogen synthase [Thermococcus bergensis]MDK2853978.1 glycogen synthase [Thermococcaceae archaeon]HIH72920.1 glycogen synthase [Thermococcaceae archaeon]
MKILMLGFEYLPVKVGGLAEAITSIAETLAKLNNEVWVFTPSHGHIDGKKLLEFDINVYGSKERVRVYERIQNGVRVFALSSNLLDNKDVYGPGWEGMLGKAVQFGKASVGLLNYLIENEGKPDVLHFHDWHTVFAGALIKKYFQLPAVFTIHRLNKSKVPAHYFHEAHLSEWAPYPDIDPEYVGAYIADVVTTVSKSYLWEEWGFYKNFEGKATYVYNGIACDFWNEELLENKELPREERRRKILESLGLSDGIAFMFIGRFDRGQKGVDTLLRAIELIAQSYPSEFSKMRFIIIGKGDPELESWAHALGAKYPENVKVVTEMLKREFTRELYGSVDFVIVPSYFEPFGLVQMEAMCLGAIPIGSAVGGIKDTIISLDEDEENATGLLVPPRDPNALAQAILRMAKIREEQPELIEKMRQNGKKRTTVFTWENACRRYMRAYKNDIDKAVEFLR